MRSQTSRILVAIASCGKYPERRAAVRTTWLCQIPENVMAFFFVGMSDASWEPGVIELKVGDSYKELPAKIHALFRFVLSNYEFDFLFKCDDDSYVALDRLNSLLDGSADYIGDRFLRRGFGSGGAGYMLSRKAVMDLANLDPPGKGAEDRWVGSKMKSFGFKTLETPRLYGRPHPAPALSNDLVTAHHCDPDTLHRIHNQFHSRPDWVTRRFFAIHRRWQGHLILYPNGNFSGGLARPNGKWRIEHNQDELILEWLHWPTDRLSKTSLGFQNKSLRLREIFRTN